MSGQVENQIGSKYVRNVNPHIGTEKKCTRCKRVKPITEYYLKKRYKETWKLARYYPRCKECIIKETSEWQKDNKEKTNKKNKRWRDRNLEHERERSKIKYLKNPQKNKERCKKWAENNPEKARALYRRSAEKYRSTPAGRLRIGIGRSICFSLKFGKNGRKWESLVGYTATELKRHIEKNFTKEMTWENYGKLWEIDHIIPIVAFNYDCPEHIDFKKCWALKNLRPLLKYKNRKKGAKINFHFQPSLKLKEVLCE